MLFPVLALFLWSAPANTELRAAVKTSVELEKQQNYDQAIAALTASYSANSGNYLLNARLGALSLLKQDYAGAERYYQAATKAAPKATEAWLGLTNACLAQSKWADAETAARKVLVLEPVNYYGKLRLAIALRQQQKHQDAAGQIQHLLLYYPADLATDQEYKALLQAAPKVAPLVKPAEVFDDKTEAAWQASLTAETNRQWADAIKALADAHKAKPKSYQLAVRLGWLHYSNNDHKSSETYYDQAIKLAPVALEAKLGRLSPLLAQGRYGDVETQASKILLADTHNYYGLYWYVVALRVQHKERTAEPYAERLALAYPTDYKVLVELAQIYHTQALRKPAAHDLFQQVLALDPGNATATAALQDNK